MEEKIKKEVKPRTAKPANPVPLRFLHQKKLKACGKLVRAACVVLTFVLLLFSFPYSQPKREKGTENKGNYY
jgi:hypothetical protein